VRTANTDVDIEEADLLHVFWAMYVGTILPSQLLCSDANFYISSGFRPQSQATALRAKGHERGGELSSLTLSGGHADQSRKTVPHRRHSSYQTLADRSRWPLTMNSMGFQVCQQPASTIEDFRLEARVSRRKAEVLTVCVSCILSICTTKCQPRSCIVWCHGVTFGSLAWVFGLGDVCLGTCYG